MPVETNVVTVHFSVTTKLDGVGYNPSLTIHGISEIEVADLCAAQNVISFIHNQVEANNGRQS